MITLIVGNPGFGKTSYMCYLAQLEMTINARSRYLAACSEINFLNSQGLNLKLPPFKHLTYGNFYCKSQIYGYSPRYMMEFNGSEFGLPDKQHKTKLIPPFSTIFLMEGQSFLDSRKSRFFRQSVSRAYEIHRHYDLNIYIDAQRSTLIDLNVRGISERIIETWKKCKVKTDDLGRIISITWFLREFSSSEEYDKYVESGGSKGNFIEFSETFNRNIFNCYDTKQDRALFYKDIEKRQFTYELVERPSLNLSYIKRFNKLHGLDKLKESDYWQKGV